MAKPVPGKLYNIVSTFRNSEEATWLSPMELFVFASIDPWGDIESTGVSIPNGTMLVFLGLETIQYTFESPWIEEDRVYFKVLLPDSTIAYILDDGYCDFRTPRS
jgi:hypothetical protein